MTAGFALLIPLWPFHSAALRVVESSQPVGVGMMTGLLTPVVLMLYQRLALVLVPQQVQEFSELILGLGILNSVTGVLSAVSETDFRRIAFRLSMSYAGLFLVAMASRTQLGVTGGNMAAMIMGIGFGGFAVLVAGLSRRSKKYELMGEDAQPVYGGMIQSAPVFAAAAAAVLLSVAFIPGSGGFSAFALMGMGTMRWVPGLIGLFGVVGLVFAITGFGVWRKVFLGKRNVEAMEWRFSVEEHLMLLPFIVILFFFGWAPQSLTELVRDATLKMYPFLN
jgi:NADH-quinone oxidoreductase subunit M